MRKLSPLGTRALPISHSIVALLNPQGIVGGGGKQMRQAWTTSIVPMAAAAVVGFAGVFFILAPDKGTSAVQTIFGSFGVAGCNVKGNVSISSGERIYHVPGQRYYAETVIRSEYGERYFCSEKQARAAGWRPSGV